MTLRRSKDRKVTNGVTKTGNAAIANSFGLPSGTAFSCPGATSFCERICYAGKLEKIYKGVKNVLLSNWNDILEADYLYGIAGMYSLLSDMISEFERDSDKRNAPKVFRIHWDGDFFSRDYAQAWAYTILSHPDTHFWVYTRSFTGPVTVTDIFEGISNVTLYLSGDSVNIGDAKVVQSEQGFPIANVAQTFAEARDAMPNGKAYNCPEIGKRIPLISPKGSACVQCGICVAGRGNVAFSASGK